MELKIQSGTWQLLSSNVFVYIQYLFWDKVYFFAIELYEKDANAEKTMTSSCSRLLGVSISVSMLNSSTSSRSKGLSVLASCATDELKNGMPSFC